MNLLQLVKRNFQYYKRKNLVLALGIAVSVTIITGALMVGDSVNYSLNKITELRLGDITHTVTAGERLFTHKLAAKVDNNLNSKVAAILKINGMGISEGGKMRVNNLQIIGVDNNFDKVTGTGDYFNNLNDNEIIISENLATRLSVKSEDEIVLRIRNTSPIPLNTPFVSDEDNSVSVRVKIKSVAHDNNIGRFNLHISQISPFNVFISHSYLNRILSLESKSNVLLLSAKKELSDKEIYKSIQNSWSAEDLNLKVKYNKTTESLNFTSEKVFIEEQIISSAKKLSREIDYILTYFVNSFKYKNSETPYSFISTLPDNILEQEEVVINSWLANDLNAKTGDSITLNYFIIGPLRELHEKQSRFKIKSIEPITGYYADKELMPFLPGLSDAGNCRDWETGVPIELDKIREKDEEYWNSYKGTPKAFIARKKAVQLWGNRFGNYTSFRIKGVKGENKITTNLIRQIDPSTVGFLVNPVMDAGKLAANNGVSFSELFISLSFFVLVGGIILMVLLFLLNLTDREPQLKTLTSLGIPDRIIRNAVLLETTIISVIGVLLGLVLAIGYNRLIFSALNGVWQDVIRTQLIHPVVSAKTIINGFISGMVISFSVIFFTLNRFLKKHKRSHIQIGSKKTRRLLWLIASVITGLLSVSLIALQIFNKEVFNPAYFFSAGILMLISLMIFVYLILKKPNSESASNFGLSQLAWKNILRNRQRSFSIILLFAIGTFLVISTGANRKDLFVNADDKSSGTGGFILISESTLPVLKDLNNSDVRLELGLEGDYKVVQFRKNTKDDASCLNLNRISQPHIIGVSPEMLEGRFSFATLTDYPNTSNPWASLNKEIQGGIIPAIADQTVIKWGLGLNVGDTLAYTNEKGKQIKLLLVGGLANSVFQGHIIISDNNFISNFPTHGGTNLFLIDGNRNDQENITKELQRTFRDYGWEMSPAPERLAEFNSIENTYLSIFMVMGALGLLLGTIGLGIMLVRSIQERSREIALLKAVGIGRKLIIKLFIKEYMLLLTMGILSGLITATISTLPALLSPNTDISLSTILIILCILFINGFTWIVILTRVFTGIPDINKVLRND